MIRPRYISLNEMETITQQILSDFGFDPLGPSFEPVPIEEIIEFHYELDLVWEPIDHYGPDSMVMAAIHPEQRLIVLNESCKHLFMSKIGTMNFTLAHELGHWVLHVSYLQNRRGTGKLESFYCEIPGKKPPVEIQADMFAGCLLMPELLLRNAVSSLKWQGPVRLHHLYELADRLKVSISALRVRLEQLGLLFVEKDGSVSYTREPTAIQLCWDI